MAHGYVTCSEEIMPNEGAPAGGGVGGSVGLSMPVKVITLKLIIINTHNQLS